MKSVFEFPRHFPRRVASWIWSLMTHAVRVAVLKGWLRATKLECRVISVGNLQAGGAGKTPLVAQIAREARERGLVTCILTRGYGGAWETEGGVILPKSEVVSEENEPPSAMDCGDEARLLHDLAPEAYIGVGRDRITQFIKIMDLLDRSPDLAILDDGFQHWKIHKDVEIVALTSKTRGEAVFRDKDEALELADLVVWTKGETPPNTGGRPLTKVRYRLAPPEKQEASYWMVTGLADGRAAYAQAARAGYTVVKHLAFSDHAQYALPRVEKILEKAQKAGVRIALTGKDWVKWRELGVNEQDVSILEPELVFESGRENWNHVLWESQSSHS